jgi:hypothetical protein
MLRKSLKRAVAGSASMSVSDVNDRPVNLCIDHKEVPNEYDTDRDSLTSSNKIIEVILNHLCTISKWVQE